MKAISLFPAVGLAAAIFALAPVSSAQASAVLSNGNATLTVTYDCAISGGGLSSPGNCIVGNSSGPFGTLVFQNATVGGHGVEDVALTLASGFPSNDNILEFLFNYGGTPTITGLKMTSPNQGSIQTIGFQQDHFQADGYSAGKFDVDVPNPGNLDPHTTSVYSFVLAGFDGSAQVDLTAADFRSQTPDGVLWSALHIGNDDGGCTGTNGCTADGQSIWLGSLVGTQEVPEPATLALFGAGLLGLGWAKRRKAN